MSNDTLSALWKRFLADGHRPSRERLIEAHMGLVRDTAMKIVRRLPSHIDADDLISSGTVGLIGALDTFEAERGHAFSTFAVPRIRGAILDELRRRDPASRRTRRLERDAKAARRRLEQELERTPTDHEVAAEMGVEVETLWEIRQKVTGAKSMPLDESPSSGEAGQGTLADVLEDPDGVSPADLAERESVRATLHRAVTELPARDRLILGLYYYQDLTMKQIGEVLGISEGRVSQLRSRIVRRLRDELQD